MRLPPGLGRARRAMSLLEVMIAISILAMMGAFTFTAVEGVVRARDLLEIQAKVDQSARVALDLIRREIELAWLTEHRDNLTAYRTVFVAQDGDPDRLWLASLSHHRLYADSRECDQTEITLWTEDDPTHDDAYVLLHREAQRIDGEPDKDGIIQPIAFGVKRFELRFLNGTKNEWVKEWDSESADTPNQLPRAVQVILSLQAPDPEDPEDTIERIYATTINLVYADPLARQTGDEEEP